MKIQPIKILPPKNTVQKKTPIKDAAVVSAYCSIPAVFHIAYFNIKDKINEKKSDTF